MARDMHREWCSYFRLGGVEMKIRDSSIVVGEFRAGL